MVNNWEPKKTKGEEKMERYIQDLIRKKDFQQAIKRLKKSYPYPTSGMYKDWSDEEKRQHDYFNNAISEIIDGYEQLRKKCKKVLGDNYSKNKNSISEGYLLDGEQINYAQALISPKNEDEVYFAKSIADLDMCKVYDLYDEELNPSNKGLEIIYLNRKRRLTLNAYPVAILIHPMASKRDVLDFIEKRWAWIENNSLRSYSEKKLKYGKRKFDQKILDFLWSNRFVRGKKLKIKLDEYFPQNGLAYYEISKILQLEKDKRLGKSS